MLNDKIRVKHTDRVEKTTYEDLEDKKWFGFDVEGFVGSLFVSYVVLFHIFIDLINNSISFTYTWAHINFIVLNILILLIWFGCKKWLSIILAFVGLYVDFLPIMYYLLLQQNSLIPSTLVFSFLTPPLAFIAICLSEWIFHIY